MPELPAPGDVVLVDFPGEQGVKRRPAVVLSTAVYHVSRPEVIVGLLTTNTAAATAQTDYTLKDWSGAGLHQQSAFRAYLVTMDQRDIRSVLGRLSVDDWAVVQERLSLALAVEGQALE